MAVYAIWNNKGGVGKSYLTFQVASEYARKHTSQKVLVIDLCPQSDSSSMLLGGMQRGEERLNEIYAAEPRRTIADYVRERIASPYQDPHAGSAFLHQVHTFNPQIVSNLYLVVGDYELELLASRVRGATTPGPDDAWAKVHQWILNLINDVKQSWGTEEITVFIDCNPSFMIYTELGLSAAERLIIPFSADGSSKRAVRTLLAYFTARPDCGVANYQSSYVSRTGLTFAFQKSTATSATDSPSIEHRPGRFALSLLRLERKSGLFGRLAQDLSTYTPPAHRHRLPASNSNKCSNLRSSTRTARPWFPVLLESQLQI